MRARVASDSLLSPDLKFEISAAGVIYHLQSLHIQKLFCTLVCLKGCPIFAFPDVSRDLSDLREPKRRK